jgi:hypothetical protein
MPEPPVSGIEEDLEVLFAQIRALHQLPSEPPAGDVYDFSVRWGTMLSGRLERLGHYAERSRLTAEQAQLYAKLRGQLREALPVIERLGLMSPRVRLAD